MHGSKMFVLLSLAHVALLRAAHLSEGQVCPASASAPAHAGMNMLQHGTSHPAEVTQAVSLKVAHSSSDARPDMSELAVNTSAKGAPGGDSIFKLHIQALDSHDYNMIFAAMIFFTILVDRVQTYVTDIAQTSTVEVRLLNRVNAELMMFGCVALAIFAVTNIWEVPSRWSTFVTHVDIYASLAAVIMIVISVMLYFMNRLIMPHLTDLKSDRAEGQPHGSATLTGRLNLVAMFRQNKMDIVASSFTKENALPDGVKYIDYLSECFVMNACDIMDIHWTSWLGVLLLSFLTESEAFARRAYDEHDEGKAESLWHHIHAYAWTNWFFFACYAVIFFDVESSYKKMMKYVESVDNGEEVQQINPMPGKTPERLKHGLQMITLCMSFQMALFVMSWIYNLNKKGGVDWIYWVYMLLPCFLGTFVLLPFTIFAVTIVDSFYDPNAEALEVLFEQYDKLEDDLNYLGRLYERKGRPSIPELQAGCDHEHLARILKHLGLHISTTRMRRIVDKLDKDGDGVIDGEEFFGYIAIAGTDSMHASIKFRSTMTQVRS